MQSVSHHVEYDSVTCTSGLCERTSLFLSQFIFLRIPLTLTVVRQWPGPFLLCRGHVRGINTDINRVANSSYGLRTQLLLVPPQLSLTPSLVGRTLISNPFIHALTEPTPTTKALADFQQKNTELLPSVPLHN